MKLDFDFCCECEKRNGWKDCCEHRKFACDHQFISDYFDSVDQWNLSCGFGWN